MPSLWIYRLFARLLLICADNTTAFTVISYTEAAQNPHSEQRKTLPQMVQERGDISVGGVVESPPIPDVTTLVRMSSLIIKGRIDSVSAHLTEDGMAIWTDFRVTVLEVIYSPTNNPDILTVSLPGGRLKLPGGWAEMSLLDLSNEAFPREGSQYIIFLRPSVQFPSKYELVGGAQGVFWVAGMKIVPLAGPERPCFDMYIGKDLMSFEGEVFDAVKRNKTHGDER